MRGQAAGFVLALAITSCGRISFDAEAGPEAIAIDGDGAIVEPMAGALDPSFGSGGISVGASSTNRERAFSLARTPDGAWLIGGTQYRDSGRASFLLGRFRPDGNLDTTWAALGWSVNGTSNYDYGYHVMPLADGRFAMIGDGSFGGQDDMSSTTVFPSGARDPSYGSNGWVRIDFGAVDTGQAGLQLGDGTLVLCGTAAYTGASRFALAGLTPAGALEPAFGTDGRVDLDLSAGNDTCRDVILDGTGRIIAAATTGSGGAVVRLDPRGALDPGFGTGGVATIPGTTSASSVAIAPDGELVVVASGGSDLMVARLGMDGEPVAGFGAGGIVTIDAGGTEVARAVAVAADGSILVAGTTVDTALAQDIVVAALAADGALDVRFGDRGLARFDVQAGSVDEVRDMQLDGVGGLIMTGWAVIGGLDRPYLLRVH